MPDKIIVDTSVLIALNKLNLLPQLCNVYSEVWITEGVKKEFGPLTLPCIVIKKSKSKLINLLIKDLNLGLGEAEVISLANENAMKMLIDDKKARKVAEDYGLSVSGTIGFLLKAKQQGLVENVYENVQRLKDTGFYVSQQLMDEIKRDTSANRPQKTND
jgi:predicted nucleic acid-binding protein